MGSIRRGVCGTDECGLGFELRTRCPNVKNDTRRASQNAAPACLACPRLRKETLPKQLLFWLPQIDLCQPLLLARNWLCVQKDRRIQWPNTCRAITRQRYRARELRRTRCYSLGRRLTGGGHRMQPSDARRASAAYVRSYTPCSRPETTSRKLLTLIFLHTES